MNDTVFARRVVIALALAASALLVWHLRGALLLAFAAVLVAVVFHTLGQWLRQRLGVPARAALPLALLAVFGVVGLTMYLFGAEVARQFDQLGRLLPPAIATAEARLREAGVLDDILAQARASLPSASAVLGLVRGIFAGVAGVVSAAGLAIVGGVYLAAAPRSNVEGVLSLFPPRGRPRAAETLEVLGHALRGWLSAQVAAMLIIGTLTTAGLWAIGNPSFLALGLIAGLTQFIPLAGPFLAAVPALLVALVMGPQMLLYTALLYVGIQQLEGNLITPMVQRRVASLPAALTIFTLVVFGALFGVAGVVLAVPLTIVAYALVGKLWIRDTLHEEVALPGDGG